MSKRAKLTVTQDDGWVEKVTTKAVDGSTRVEERRFNSKRARTSEARFDERAKLDVLRRVTGSDCLPYSAMARAALKRMSENSMAFNRLHPGWRDCPESLAANIVLNVRTYGASDVGPIPWSRLMTIDQWQDHELAAMLLSKSVTDQLIVSSDRGSVVVRVLNIYPHEREATLRLHVKGHKPRTFFMEADAFLLKSIAKGEDVVHITTLAKSLGYEMGIKTPLIKQVHDLS